LQKQTIKGICFFPLRLVNIHTKSSCFINTLQIIYNQTDKARIAVKKEKTKAGKQRTKQGTNLPKGRPKKEHNPNEDRTKQEDKNSTASFRVFKALFEGSLKSLKSLIFDIKITHLVADYAFRGTPSQNAVINFFKRTGMPCESITFDNGKEFTNHQEITNTIGVKIYFANPYHSWERDTNENTNGLIRQYIPKKSDFCNYSVENIAEIQQNLIIDQEKH
jgi:IS30 family transposase